MVRMECCCVRQQLESLHGGFYWFVKLCICQALAFSRILCKLIRYMSCVWTESSCAISGRRRIRNLCICTCCIPYFQRKRLPREWHNHSLAPCTQSTRLRIWIHRKTCHSYIEHQPCHWLFQHMLLDHQDRCVRSVPVFPLRREHSRNPQLRRRRMSGRRSRLASLLLLFWTYPWSFQAMFRIRSICPELYRKVRRMCHDHKQFWYLEISWTVWGTYNWRSWTPEPGRSEQNTWKWKPQ